MTNFAQTPWLAEQDFLEIDLTVASDNFLSDDGRVGLYPSAKAPAYLELGSNVLELTNLKLEGTPALLAVILDGQGKPGAQQVFANGHHEIGRHATPGLSLNRSASRKHLGLTVMTNSIQLRDLNSRNGSILHVKDSAVSQGQWTNITSDPYRK